MALKKLGIAIDEAEINDLDELVDKMNAEYETNFPGENIKTTRNHQIRKAIQEYIKNHKE